MTSIEWCHATFNPWIGCTKVHTGCRGCYAEVSPAAKFKGIRWGAGAPRYVTGEDNWKKPLAWARAAAKAGARRRVFCASLADVLDEEAPTEAQARLWDLVRQTARIEWDLRGEKVSEGGLDWLLLTKRPERWRLIPEDVRPLVWFGTSISDQATADEWVPRLLAAEEFRLRFLSVEPMIGPVDLRRYMWPVHARWPAGFSTPEEASADGAEVTMHRQALVSAHARFLDWVIVGGESGSGARPFEIAWGRALRDQCRDARVPFFWKQLGRHPVIRAPQHHKHPLGPDREWPIGTLFGNPLYATRPNLNGRVARINDEKGGDMSQWPEDCRVREFPEALHA